MADAKAHNASALSVSTGQSCQNPIKELQWSCPRRDFILAILFVKPFFKLAPSSFPPLHHCPKLYMQWIWLYLSFHCLVFWGPNFPCCFFKVIHWKEGPSSWQPRPYLLNLLPTFSVLLSQSYHVNHTMELHYLFPMSSCGKRSWFP